MKEKDNQKGTRRLRAAIGTPDGDGFVSAAAETTADGFVAVVPALEREALDAELTRLAADLPAGSALQAQIGGGDAVVTASGLVALPELERAAIAARVVDALCAAEGGAR